MRRYNLNINGITRKLTIAILMLFALAGNALAQSSGRFVIKTTVGTTTHYLAHVKVGENWVLRDVDFFHPDSCLWISDNTYTQGGTNKNYYFMDDQTPSVPRFLCAPEFHAGGALTLSTTMPPTSYLNNPEYQYYFYKWDSGLGRGVQYYGVSQDWCNEHHPYGWDAGECWEVYWVSYHVQDDIWKLSEERYHLSDVPTGGKFYHVTVTEHPEETTTLSGGLEDLEDFEMEYQSSHQISPSIDDYQYSVTPAYITYYFDEATHNFYDDGNGLADQGENTPDAVESGINDADDATYSWSIMGEGAGYLSFASGSNVTTSTDPEPTIYYRTENTTGHKTATVTLTVTYGTGGPQQTRTATVLVKTQCQNPPSFSATANELGATVTWTPTADSYIVSWRRQGTTAWNSVTVSNTTSYTITGLEYGNKVYQYKVKATCDTDEPDPQIFTTLEDPGLMVAGAIFGGGRMADVAGKTEVVIINCGNIGAVYGGNDIAGSVVGADGSTITLGVDEGGTYASYGVTPENGSVRVGSVYGGGNGYYAYNGTSFEPASDEYTSETVPVDGHINAMTQSHQVGEVAWTNEGTEPKTLNFPSIVKTAITVTNDKVKVDSIFGGAKNAFLTFNDYNNNGSTITINGGTVFAVFGGNNFGGTQKGGRHYIEVNHTTTKLEANIHNTSGAGYGRTFGIRYLFGGGNKVEGSSTYIYINGGQCDTIFAGGNAADVYYANLWVNCVMEANSGTEYVYGKLYSNAVDTYESGVITPKTTYGWDGISGIYNVRTLFGGNNKAEMTRVPNIYLTSGSIGTVYGGGNAGDMAGLATKDAEDNPVIINGKNIRYSTHVELSSASMLVDFLYGGCQMSSVANSTWVELKKGHVGTVYGGCNISGDVGSTRVYDTYAGGATYPTTLEEQEVKGATYVVAGGANDDNIFVYNNIYAGSNGYYNCSNDGIHYNNVASPYFNDPTGLYNRMEIPTHNETNVIISKGVTVKGSVYAGGNMAPVGFDDDTGFDRGYPELIGMASVRMDDGLVEGNVYGGGNMASIFGSNEVRVSGGRIGIALYGGNDRAGKVAEKSKRILPSEYIYASDTRTKLIGEGGLGVKTYVSVSGWANVGTVYGGGNGAYPPGSIHYCYEDDEPVQSNTFVDININGGALNTGGAINPLTDGGRIGTVYGGGNGVTTWDGVTVFLNVKDPVYDRNHVGTIFGGNNMGDLDVVPDIYLLRGQVGTVYGGCNQGAMIDDGKTVGGYSGIGSYVRLIRKYDPDNSGQSMDITAKVTEAIYGGCRMNGVTNNSLVLVEGGDFSDIPIFGGSDISGHVGGWSRVVVSRDAPEGSVCTVGDVYGGGNGNYVYQNNNVYYLDDLDHPIAEGTEEHPITAPTCANSGADILRGQVGASGEGNEGNVFGGGWGPNTSTTGDVEVNIGIVDAANANACPVIYGAIYGGSALGEVNTDGDDNTTVSFLNGTLHGDLYGGGLGDASHAAKVNGKVTVYISTSTQDIDNCFIDLRDANIYGCNNTNGSPQDDVTVHIYKTGYTTDDYDSQTGTLYAINEVFGGGNQADYRPVAVGEDETPHQTLVFVHDCLNTINRVFSGGNAAYAEGVAATIEGGRFDYVFGGGNGESGTAADIGYGGTHLLVEAGIINHLFGGSNAHGDILGDTKTEINGDLTTEACKEEITEFFGGSNIAPLGTNGHSANITAVVKCSNGKTGFFNEIYGGSKQAAIIGNVTLSIKGGECIDAFGGSKGDLHDLGTGHEDVAADITGNVTLNLEGGTITNAFGGSNLNGNITGNIVVNVIDLGGECGLDLTNVYGGGNVTAYTPTYATITSPVVNVVHIADPQGIKGNVFGGAKGSTATVSANPQVNFGYNATTMSIYLPIGYTVPDSPRAYISGDVFGGGDQAAVGTTGEGAVICNTEVNVYKGEIVKRLVGGGNEAGISGNVTVNISGGLLCTSENIEEVGIYGGCNNSGTVGGNVVMTITGSDDSQTTIGVEDVVTDSKKPVNVHGGGFGKDTEVSGNVTVNFGAIVIDESGEASVEVQSVYPKLYGDLYGGSALGNVNTNATNTTTTVNVLNGTLIPVSETLEVPGQPHPVTYYYSGNIFGGGLGRLGEDAVIDPETGDIITPAVDPVEALVKGEVHVNIGRSDAPPSRDLHGMATLIGCNVYGCNNTYGTPKDDVHVDIYQTAHTDANNVNGSDYAILRVFGGGNEANYDPVDVMANKTRVYVHGCDNTIKFVYGGGNAADAAGVETVVEGGRFDEIYGGGNGQIRAANIGQGGVGFKVLAGRVNFLYQGCNKAGTINGTTYDAIPDPGYVECGDLYVESYYFGDNEAEHYGDIINTITCAQASEFDYKYVFAGSRWAIVYGDIKLTVQGGNIKYLFGGSKGYYHDNIPADVRRFPSVEEIDAMNAIHPGYYSAEVRAYVVANPGVVHTGGNIELILQGGTIGEVIGGCDELGNVEGKITVVIDGDPQSENCPLFVGNVYGASNETNYAPVYDIYIPGSATTKPTPKVNVLKGTIGGTASFVVDDPPTPIGFDGNVFGGGDDGNATSNPKVIIGDGTVGVGATKVTVKGDVFGGGNEGNVNGSPQVVVVPNKRTLTVNPSNYLTGGTPETAPGGGTLLVRNNECSNAAIQMEIGENVDIPIVATPAAATSSGGYAFDHWTIDGDGVAAGATVGNPYSPTSTFTMGTGNATLTATFALVPAWTLTMESSEHGTFKVNGAAYTAPVYVAQYASVTVEAIPATGYAFKEWEVVSGTGASVNNKLAQTTIFNMGTGTAVLRAIFEPLYTLTLASDLANSCKIKVNSQTFDEGTGSVQMIAGARVLVQCIPNEGYEFEEWVLLPTDPEGELSGAELGNASASATAFTMGTANVTLTAKCHSTRTNNNRNSRR